MSNSLIAKCGNHSGKGACPISKAPPRGITDETVPHPWRRNPPGRTRKEGRLKALFAAVSGTLLVACTASTGPAAPDMGPVGDGLKVIGFALIGVSVVITLGRLIR